MDLNTKVHPCYYDPAHLVSCKEKKEVNLRMELKILQLLKDVEARTQYIHKYWYNLKYFIQSLHGTYRLLYKVLCIFVNSSMRSKLSCHDLINGPRPVKENLKLFKQLIVFTQIQTQLVGSIVHFDLRPHVQDQISKTNFCLTTFTFLAKIIWYDNSTTAIFRHGLPVKLNFL